MRSLRVAVIGGGHLGKIHARILGANPSVQIVAVADTCRDSRQRIESDLGVTVVEDYRQLRSQIDAAIVATPTSIHYPVAIDLLNCGIDTLVEKPITNTVQQADHLIHTADQQQVVLQVGHVERFNPAFEKASELNQSPRYFEARRTSGYTFRSTDIGVVHDLMIHDIDLIASMVASPLLEARAIGVAVFGPHEDIAQARLEFANGTVANLTASRCSFESQRQISWFSEQGFVSADLTSGEVCTIDGSQIPTARRDVHQLTPQQQENIQQALFDDVLPMRQIPTTSHNAIEQEQRDFFDAIRQGRSPRVTGRHGRQALSIASTIIDSIQAHRWNDGRTTRVGAQAEKLKLLRPIQEFSRRRAG